MENPFGENLKVAWKFLIPVEDDWNLHLVSSSMYLSHCLLEINQVMSSIHPKINALNKYVYILFDVRCWRPSILWSMPTQCKLNTPHLMEPLKVVGLEFALEAFWCGNSKHNRSNFIKNMKDQKTHFGGVIIED